MRFQLNIHLGNEAMQTNGDIAELLRELAAKFDRYGTDPCALEGATVRDLNGNTVGEWEILHTRRGELEDARARRTLEVLEGQRAAGLVADESEVQS